MTAAPSGPSVPSDPRAFDAPRGERTAADGLVIVDKPQGWTSHDVVARVRRMAATRKVGHAGTLDPLATGVLVVGVGRATRLLTYVVGATKTYEATIRLGQDTVTDDAQGDVTRTPGAGDVGGARLEAALDRLRGDIDQVPSAVSAIKVDGRRSYARVRAGEDVELAARRVTVSRFEVTSDPVAVDLPAGGGVRVLDVPVVVDCSSGTYIRALARDLGADLGTGGHLTALRRTAVGPIDVTGAATLDDLASAVLEGGELPVTGLTEACTALFPARVLDARQAADVRVGKKLAALGGSGASDGATLGSPVAALAPDGHVVALLEERGGAAHPVLVLDPA